MLWKEYLYESGLLGNASKEKIEAIRREFQKAGKMEWQAERRKQIIRFEVRFEKSEEEEIRAVAKANGLKVSQLLKLCYYSCIYNYWESPNPVKVEQLLTAQNRIGNNINQVVREANRTGLHLEQINTLHSLQLEIKKGFEGLAVKEPITTRIEKAVEHRPETLALILDVLVDHIVKQPHILALLLKTLSQKDSKLFNKLVQQLIQ